MCCDEICLHLENEENEKRGVGAALHIQNNNDYVDTTVRKMFINISADVECKYLCKRLPIFITFKCVTVIVSVCARACAGLRMASVPVTIGGLSVRRAVAGVAVAVVEFRLMIINGGS